MVATQAGVASIGTRRTRREHRARKRRVPLGKSISTTLRKSVFIVVDMLVTVIEVVGRRVRRGLLWGLVVVVALLVFTAEKGKLLLAGASQDVRDGVMPVAAKGFERDPLLFVAFLGSGLAAVAYVMVGKVSLAIVFCLLAALICVGLWIGDKRGGAE